MPRRSTPAGTTTWTRRRTGLAYWRARSTPRKARRGSRRVRDLETESASGVRLAGVERDERGRAGKAVGGGQVDRVERSQLPAAADLRCSGETQVVDRNDEEALPVCVERGDLLALRCVLQTDVADGHVCLGERERRGGAP
jgi:hypothetical protein